MIQWGNDMKLTMNTIPKIASAVLMAAAAVVLNLIVRRACCALNDDDEIDSPKGDASEHTA